MLLKLFLIFSFVNFLFCNVIREKVSNPVMFPYRNDHISILLSENCSFNTYQNLMHGVFKLEQPAHETFAGENYNINVVFGGIRNVSFTKSDQFFQSFEKTWRKEAENCFEESLSDDVEDIVLNTVDTNKPCPEILVKEFILIASDICLTTLNKPLNDLDHCSKKYRNVALLLPTKNDVEKCRKQILQITYALNIRLYSSETISSNDTDIHSDMKVLYQTTYAESTFNLLVMVNEFFSFAYYFFDPKLPNFPEFPLCRKGSISGFFQYISLNTPTQKVIKMTSPLDYKSNSVFPQTYKDEVKKATEEPYNCDFIKEFLITANSMPFNGSQYNMLLINDPYPSCLNFELLWNNTNVGLICIRYLDLPKIHMSAPEEKSQTCFAIF